MALELKQQIKLSQQLVMTPQLQQAIRLLQLSNLELATELQQQLDENPLLEQVLDEDASAESEESEESAEESAEGADGTAEPAGAEPEAEAAAVSSEEPAPVDASELPETPQPEPSADEMVSDVDWESYIESRPQTSMAQPADDRPPPEDNVAPATSLTEHLSWQLGFLDLSEDEERAGGEIIGNLNDDGYLEEDLESIAGAACVEVGVAEKMLYRVQELDPAGVAARSLSECLELQARRAGVTHSLVLKIIGEHLDPLQRKDFRGIANLENAMLEEIATAADVIASFEPRPGRQFSAEDFIYITPDIFVEKVGDEYHVVLNEDDVPNLRVSAAYRAVLRNSQAAKETREYVREKLRSAQFWIKSIEQRKRTIVKVVQSILRFQREFFDKGTEHLRPLNLRDVAEDIGMHESTVSRVTTNKYVQTPHGIFELKFFFNSSIQTADGDAIASESVKEKIRTIIANEDARRPLSDQRIAEVLKAASINIARRTVTKYRESMRILSSTRRRQFR